MGISIDIIDKQILSILQKNARESASSVAEKINLSIPATSDRIKKMQDSNVILGYTAIVNYK